METNLLIKTTFKNNLSLLKPFYNFHKDVWNPRRFCFIIGYTGTEEEEKKKIQKIFPSMRFEDQILVEEPEIGELAWNMKIFHHEEIYIILYGTKLKHSNPKEWDSLRSKLLRKTEKYVDDGKFKRHLSVDNDDFHYVGDPEKALENDLIFFHSLEFVPPRRLLPESDFLFVGCRYFFREKASGHKIRNTCGNCSVIDWRKYDSISHSQPPEIMKRKKKECRKILKGYKNGINGRKIKDMDGFCFSFSCLSLEYLLKEKHWTYSQSDPTMIHRLDNKALIKNFMDNYTLTEDETKTTTCVKVNDFKKYFF